VVVTFTTDRYFRLVDKGLRGPEGNITTGRMREASSAFIPKYTHLIHIHSCLRMMLHYDIPYLPKYKMTLIEDDHPDKNMSV
jgi:hypothetical protein